jgi:hypothetical protein
MAAKEMPKNSQLRRAARRNGQTHDSMGPSKRRPTPKAGILPLKGPINALDQYPCIVQFLHCQYIILPQTNLMLHIQKDCHVAFLVKRGSGCLLQVDGHKPKPH